MMDDYLRCYEVGRSDAVWTRVKDRHLNLNEQMAELNRIEAAGWFVKPHFSSDEGGIDKVLFEPPQRD